MCSTKNMNREFVLEEAECSLLPMFRFGFYLCKNQMFPGTISFYPFVFWRLCHTSQVAQWFYLPSRRHGFSPWVRKIPWRRAWQPTPVFLPGESHEQRSLAGYSPCGRRRLRHDWVTKLMGFSSPSGDGTQAPISKRGRVLTTGPPGNSPKLFPYKLYGNLEAEQ